MTQLPAKAVPIIFDNQTTEPMCVQFLGGLGSGQVGAGGAVALAGDTSYPLAKLASKVPGFPDLGKVPNVFLNSYSAGRIYLNFGDTGLLNLGNNYQPSSNTPTDPNYYTNYAYLELNVSGSSSNNMDLTNIDFFSMAITATTWSGGNPVHSRTYNNNTPQGLGAAAEALAALSGGTAVVRDNNGAFVRICGPGLPPPNGAYKGWCDYFKFLADQPDPPVIAGTYGGQGPGSTGPVGQQDYELKATFGAKSVQLEGTAHVVGPTTITICYDDLNQPTGGYGCNPPYSVNGGPKAPGGNDVYTWIVADLLTALNCGLLGSSTMVGGHALGDYTSTEMFKLVLEQPSLMFGGAQTNSNFYNGYAAQMLKMSTDVYSFPYSDRVQQPLLYFPPEGQANGVDYLVISILPIAY